MACIPLWSSAVRIHDSQAYKKMDVTREYIRYDTYNMSDGKTTATTKAELLSHTGACNVSVFTHVMMM